MGTLRDRRTKRTNTKRRRNREKMVDIEKRNGQKDTKSEKTFTNLLVGHFFARSTK